MKILHIAEFGKRASGIGTVVERLYTGQFQSGHDVRIVTITQNLAYKHLELDTCLSQKEFDDFLSRWQPDAVLFHSIWAMPYIGFSKTLNKLHIPYAIMMHGADSKVNRQSAPIKKWLANTLWFNRFMKDARALIFLSRTEEKNCLSAKNNKNNVIIPNGCDKGELCEDQHAIKEPANIIYLGRLARYTKGVDYLLDALEILKNRGYNEARLSFYANENDVDLQYLKDRLPALEGIAAYCGGVYGEEKVQVLKNADAFILTSRSEGMPMGVLEAMSYGVPCILTPGTNMAEELAESGAGWKSEFSAEAIADTIQRAVADIKSNPTSYRLAAYRLSLNYDWDKIVEMHTELMKQICNG